MIVSRTTDADTDKLPPTTPSTASLAIIGAGAAGLTVAIAAAETFAQSGHPARVLVLDGAKLIGAKLLVSGGGRCNVTHHAVTPADYFGNQRLIRNILAAFSVEQTRAWFKSLGVEFQCEATGKLFPVTNKSRTVLNALIERCQALEVEIQTGRRVLDIEQLSDGTGFLVRHSHGTVQAEKVILATGGQSLPRTGSDGVGYRLARSLGHLISPTAPALVPLELHDSMFHAALSGLSHAVELMTVTDGHEVDRRMGSLLWTHFGISGPVVMDASRFWTLATDRGASVELYGNFLPKWTSESLKEWLIAQATEHPKRSLGNTLAQVLPHRLAESLCRHSACDPQKPLAQLSRTERHHVSVVLTKFRFPITRDRGWNFAEVTAGGVPLEEIDYRTMESKRVSGLYLVGEILDCDGRIGGFNFQWAWTTGWLAGRSAATSFHATARP